jgi:hypothetical protein
MRSEVLKTISLSFSSKSIVFLLMSTACAGQDAQVRSERKGSAGDDRQATAQDKPASGEDSPGTAPDKPATEAAADPKTTPKTTPKTKRWIGTISGGIQYESGRLHADGVQMAGDIAKSFNPADTLSFDGTLTYATYRIPPSPRADSTNNTWFGAQMVHRLNNRFFLADRAIFNRDLVIGIDHRELNGTGVGINLFLSEKGQFYVVPAFGVGEQLTAVRAINGFTTGFVSYEKFTYKLNPAWSVVQYSMWRTSDAHSHDMSIKAYGGLEAPALYKRLYISIGLDYDYEGVLSPAFLGVTRNDAVFAVKFKYRFGG